MAEFRPGQGAIIIGLRGQGKTRLIWAVIAGIKSWVAMDGKHDPQEWAAFGHRMGAVVTSDPEAIRRYPRVVYQVPQMALDDRAGWRKPGSEGWDWTLANTYAFGRGNTTVIFDDALEQLPASGANPNARRICTQGRSLGVSAIVAAQTPNWLDTRMLRQLEHAFVLPAGQAAGDLQLLAQQRNADPAPLAAQPPYHFLYQPEVGHPWVACAPAPRIF